jgi:acyl-CoA thioesterase YciA
MFSLSLQVKMSTSDTGSALALRTVALPAFTNAHGDIFGGWLLSQMDLAGGTVATRLAQGRIVTVAVTEMSFQLPVFVGDEVTCFADVVKIGRCSIAVKISAFARRGRNGEDIKVTEGLFTYVAVDAKGKPRPVQAHVATRRGADQ